ncbi:hypothetical protein [Nocardia mangyaensis]|uniref:hypothetical protein n=1 Tax=Nocardia mangyaensis TaxID=2213200 RepID=UPI0026766BED|nr:hypothetical protein [Nocardia mangyaensis]MDO3647674.1 hypothetical protein [Nocardia mangyaensis]
MTAIRTADDVRAVWRKYFGDRPVPTVDRRAERLRRALADSEREQIRRDQIEAARQRIEAANQAPWPEAEAAWIEATRLARAVFVQ